MGQKLCYIHCQEAGRPETCRTISDLYHENKKFQTGIDKQIANFKKRVKNGSRDKDSRDLGSFENNLKMREPILMLPGRSKNKDENEMEKGTYVFFCSFVANCSSLCLGPCPAHCHLHSPCSCPASLPSALSLPSCIAFFTFPALAQLHHLLNFRCPTSMTISSPVSLPYFNAFSTLVAPVHLRLHSPLRASTLSLFFVHASFHRFLHAFRPGATTLSLSSCSWHASSSPPLTFAQVLHVTISWAFATYSSAVAGSTLTGRSPDSKK